MKILHNFLDKLHNTEVLRHRHYRSETAPSKMHLSLRFYAGIGMLILALIGVILTDFAPSFASHYWFYAVPIFALINILLSWHAAVAHRDFILVWHELLHWLILLVMIFIVSIFLSMGTISDVTAGIVMLSLLSLATLLAGVHFDSMLIIIGIILVLLDLLSAVFIEFSMFILVPLIIVAAVLIFWRTRSHKKRAQEESLDDDKPSSHDSTKTYDKDLDDDL
ncbi:MAG: hypothetical protein CMF39_03960 [Legionellaceae bacterium]|nr:hypothetical protein [Legionellaceae bacterium]